MFSEQIVIPTPEALSNYMSEMKMIVEDPKLKTIVTNITIDGLDQMKKESKEARDVTRWLDLVFSRCVGNVQTMQQGEQKSIQRLRRSDYTAWILQHLVNIGTKLQRQRKQVVLLVDSEDRQVSQNRRAPGLDARVYPGAADKTTLGLQSASKWIQFS